MAFDSYTKSLLHFDGTDAATTFTDETGKVWTAAADAQIDTAQKKFGTASGLFDGTGDYISTPDHADWNFGTGDFAIDLWVRFNALPTKAGGTNYVMPLVGQVTDASNGWFFIIWTQNGGDYTLRFYSESGGVAVYSHNIAFASAATATWYHFVVSRASGVSYIFVDGTLLSSVAASGTLPDLASDVQVGTAAAMFTSTIQNFNGWIDELRISKGIARWTADFTPPGYAYSGTTAVSLAGSLTSSGTLTEAMSTRIKLNANPRNYALKGMEKGLFGTPVLVTTTKNWVDSAGNQMVDSSGNHLVFNAGSTTYPYVLNARKRNYELRAPKVKHG